MYCPSAKSTFLIRKYQYTNSETVRCLLAPPRLQRENQSSNYQIYWEVTHGRKEGDGW
jgi:hypothetical protein